MKLIHIFTNFLQSRKESFINSLLIVTNLHLYVALYNFYYYRIFQYNNVYISLSFSIIYSIITNNYVLCTEHVIVLGLCFYLHMMHKIDYKYNISDKVITKLARNKWLNNKYL